MCTGQNFDMLYFVEKISDLNFTLLFGSGVACVKSIPSSHAQLKTKINKKNTKNEPERGAQSRERREKTNPKNR